MQIVADIPAILKMMRTRQVSFLADDGNDIDVKDPATKRVKTVHEDAPDAIPCMEIINGLPEEAADDLPARTCVVNAKHRDVTVIAISDSDDESAGDDSGDDPSEDSDGESAEE